MKRLRYSDISYEADKIYKTSTEIVGQDSYGNEVFSFKGITDFDIFTLEEGKIFDVDGDMKLRADVDYLLMILGEE